MNNDSIIDNNNVDITSKPNEDIDLIDLINSFLKKKRGYIVKIPKPGSAVLCCMSGGLDSTATIAILLDKFKLQIYPFFINRNQSNYNYEKKSVNYYGKIFKKKYPKQYHNCKEIKINTPSLSYKDSLNPTLRENHIGYPARNSVIFLTGAEYAYSLLSQNIKINTIFGAAVVSDGLFHSSLTWTRVTNLAICQMFNNYNWQLISLAIEQEFGNSYDKDVMIKYCNSIGIDLSLTRTCVDSTSIQCGKCICCYDRRRCFKQANVKDNTKYLYN